MTGHAPSTAAPGQLVVRPAAHADRPRLVAVIGSDATFTADETAVALELIDLALADSRDYLVRVAERDGALLGYICYGPTPMTAATYDLYWIVVDAAARGQGAARALIETMERDVRSRGGRQVRVETSQTEAYGSARHLYARLGYPEVSRLVDFYKPGDDLITYYKQL